MLYLALFAIVSAIGIISAALIFKFKDILYAGLCLASIFLVNSLLFILLNQPLLAVIQLFIMIGGITTFIFVGVASATYSEFKYTRMIGLLLLWIFVFAVMAAPLTFMQFDATQSNIFGADDIAGTLSSSAGLFYLMALLMFGVAIGATLLLKKPSEKK